MTGYGEDMDKTQYQILLQDFEERWAKDYTRNFVKRDIDNINAQITTNKRMLKYATSLDECKLVESRVRNLEEWIVRHIENGMVRNKA